MADVLLKKAPEVQKPPVKVRVDSAVIDMNIPLTDETGAEVQTARVSFTMQDGKLSDAKRTKLRKIVVDLATMAELI